MDRLDSWSFPQSQWINSGCEQLSTLDKKRNLTYSKCPQLGIYSMSRPKFPGSNQGIYFFHFVQRVEPVVQLGTVLCVLFCLILIVTYTFFNRWAFLFTDFFLFCFRLF